MAGDDTGGDVTHGSVWVWAVGARATYHCDDISSPKFCFRSSENGVIGCCLG